MFAENAVFNQDLSHFNTTKGSTMQGMFRYASSFNQPLPWTTSLVEDMDELFLGTPFNNDLSSWDTSSLTSCRLIFAQNKVFNSPMFSEVSKVLRMAGGFLNAISFNQSLAGWQTAEVTDMRSLFFNTTAYHEVLCWDLSNRVQVDDMFCGSLASFNASCVRLKGLVEKTLADCDSFREDDLNGGGGGSASNSWMRHQNVSILLLLAASAVSLLL